MSASIASADINRLADALRASAGNSEVTNQNVLVQAANYIKGDMESLVPVRTGRLKQSIQIRVGSHSVTIGPHTDYDAFVEFGTKPHIIKAKNKKALMFYSGGRQVIVKEVHHPGTKAQPYVRPAFEHWVNTLGAMAAEANVQEIGKQYR